VYDLLELFFFKDNAYVDFHLGDVVESFFMDLRFDGLYRTWPFLCTRLAIDKMSLSLVESTFCHFIALEACIFFFIGVLRKLFYFKTHDEIFDNTGACK